MSGIPVRLNLSPEETWQFASRAASAKLAIKVGRCEVPKGYLCEIRNYQIYLDNDAPKENPDWEIAQRLLEKLGV